MSQNRKISSLVSSQATGGDIAEGGFQYQANLITARIPNWLSQDGFTEMIRESLGDVEAKFFVPSSGFRREFVQYKNHNMTPSEFWRAIEHFQKMDQESASSYQRFVLACAGVSNTLKPMINALRRVRDAYPFYNGAQQILDISYHDFVKAVEKLDKSMGMADFLFFKVCFEVDLTDAEDHPRELFRETLFQNFPIFTELKANLSTEACSRLVELVQSRKNQPIFRRELEEAIWKSAEAEGRPEPSIRIHTTHDDSDKAPEGCLQFNWKSCFGGSERNFPPAEEWNNQVIGELESTKTWLVSTQQPRRLHLSGHRRLSASIAIGSVFSAVSGFVIGMKTKEGIWWTDNHPQADTPDYPWERDIHDDESTGEMVVGISIKRKIANEVERYLETTHFRGTQLHLFSDNAMLSAAHTNQAVEKAKQMINESVAAVGAKKIHLFIAVPAQFALFLGHRLNAMGEIQCYEYQDANVYVPTCLISA